MTNAGRIPTEEQILNAMFNDLNIFFRDCRGKNTRYNELGPQKLSIPANIYVDDSKCHIEIAIVGAKPEAISVEKIEADVIRIQYTKPDHEDESGRHYFSKSLSKKDIDLQLKIDNKYDIDKINPTYEQGLLVIDIPLAEGSEPKKFAVQG